MSNRIIRNLPDSKYKAVVGNTLAGESNPFVTLSEAIAMRSDWNENEETAGGYIANKPAVRAGAGTNSIIEGNIGNNVAGGFYSHAEGSETTASGYYSHAEGRGTTASGENSHAESGGTTASGSTSHAEGGGTTASGSYSHAEGGSTTASGYYSHAEGKGTTAKNRSQHVFGEFNTVDPSSALSSARGNYVEIVGNGTTTTNLSNARTLIGRVMKFWQVKLLQMG